MNKLKPCPFCGGNGKLSFAEVEFGGRNYIGDKKSKYRVQIICTRCHSRGMPIKTDLLINCEPAVSNWMNKRYEMPEIRHKQTEMLRPWVEIAIAAWNRRCSDA